jgi:hypothetical protein
VLLCRKARTRRCAHGLQSSAGLGVVPRFFSMCEPRGKSVPRGNHKHSWKRFRRCTRCSAQPQRSYHYRGSWISHQRGPSCRSSQTVGRLPSGYSRLPRELSMVRKHSVVFCSNTLREC